MELKVNEYQVTPEITFNYDELKAEISERVSYYKDLVYTDAEMKQAKADRAQLRKFVEAIDARRKEIKAEVMAPYTALEAKLDEIKAIVQEPINMIDNQVKAYEELQRKTKAESIRQTFENKGFSWMADLVWNPKWLNTTYSMKNITAEIDETIAKCNNDIATLEALTEYSFEAIEDYKKHLDLGRTMVMVNDLREQAKRKAEYEAQKEATKDIPHPAPTPEQPDDFIQKEPGDPQRFWVKFECCVSEREARWLREFFEANGIAYKAMV